MFLRVNSKCAHHFASSVLDCGLRRTSSICKSTGLLSSGPWLESSHARHLFRSTPDSVA